MAYRLPSNFRTEAATPKRRVKRKRYTLPKTFSTEAAQGGHTRRRATRPAPVTQPGPYTAKERRKVRRHKQTKRYKRALKAARRSKKRAENFRRAQQTLALIDRSMADARSSGGGGFDLSDAISDVAGSAADKFMDLAKLRSEAEVRGLEPNVTERAIAKALKDPAGALRRRGTGQAISQAGVGGSVGLEKGLLGVADVGEAFWERPGKTLKSTGKSVGPMLAGIIPGLVHAVDDPVKTYEQVKKDYKRRFKHAGTEKNVRRIQREGPIPELLDVGTAGFVASRAAGLAGRSGMAGPRLKAAMTEQRPKLRTAPGVVRRQRKSKGAVGAVAQRKLDKQRAEAQLRRERKAREDPDRYPLRVEDAQGVETGTVVPLTRLGGRRARTKRFDQEQGTTRVRMKRKVSEEVTKGTRKTESSLSRPEKVAFSYAMEGHIPLLGTKAQKLAALDRLEEFFVKGRKAAGTQIKGRTRQKYNNELKNIAYLREHVDEAFTPRLIEAVEAEIQREHRLAEVDPALATQQAELSRTGPQHELLIGPRREGESVAAYQARGRAAREEAELPKPGYIKHQAEPFEVRRSDYALGTGQHGISRPPKRRTGTAFRTGTRDVRMEVLHQSRAKNIKRAEQWNFVIRNAEDNALKTLRDVESNEIIDVSKGGTRVEMLEAIDRSAMDPTGVVLIRVGKLRKEAENPESPLFEDDVVASSAATVGENILRVQRGENGLELRTANGKPVTSPDELIDDGGWHIAPAEIGRRMAGQGTQMVFGRIVRKYIKGWPSKLLLGTNPSWAVIQVMNNQLLAALGGVGPVTIAKSVKFFKKHPEAQRTMDDALGSTFFEAERAGGKIGAAAPKWRIVEEWRALKETPLFRWLGDHNPLDYLFKGDHANNAIHRRAVSYDFLKGTAYREMGESVTGFGVAMRKLEHTFDLGPERQMLELVKHPEWVEEAVSHVDRLMGNFSRYTPWERQILEQNVMFYGFLRFSLRFTFHTLPVGHPIIGNLVYNLSRLHEREVRKLLGLNRGDPLPPGVLASYYIQGGELKEMPWMKLPGVKDIPGLGEIPLSRLNPTQNVLTNAGVGPKAALLVLPPTVLAVLNNAFHKDLFTGKAHRIRGESTPRETRENPERYPLFDVPTFFAELISLIRPTQIAEDVRAKGQPVGADYIPFLHERPTQYAFMSKPRHEWTSADEELARSLRERRKEAEGKSVFQYILEDQVPFIPRRSFARQRSKDLIEGLHPKKKKRTLDEIIDDRLSGGSDVDSLIERRLEGPQDVDDLIEKRLGR